jgi:hypothetical protein
MAKIIKMLKWGGVLVALAVLTLLSLRIYDVQRGPPLARWHTYVSHELRAKELDAADWSRYLAEEEPLFQAVRTEVSQKLDADERIPINRSDGAPVGAVVLLHGLTDAPYNQRHIARAYRDRGFVAIVSEAVERATEAGDTTERTRALEASAE